MNFIQNCFKGIAIGSGAILPGISSGVFCVIFGIYEKLLDSILNFFKNIKANIKFLFPILIGSALGFFIFGNILNYCLYSFPIQTKSIFIGLILGSIPALLKEVNKKEKFKPCYLIFFTFALIVGVISIFLENFLKITTITNFNTLYIIFCGILMSFRNYYSWCQQYNNINAFRNLQYVFIICVYTKFPVSNSSWCWHNYW